MDWVVEVEDLVRVFRTHQRREGLLGAITDLFRQERHDIQALAGITFKVRPAECVALLGPNGAGKSTLVKILAGVLYPTRGSVRVDGLNPWRDRHRHRHVIGVMFGHRSALWWNIPVLESLRFLADIYAVGPRDYKYTLDELCELLELTPLLRLPPRELSLGQRMRCELAASLIHRPRLLLLDEPTIGLDIIAKIRIRAHLKELADKGNSTVLLSSHDLLEVEGLASRTLVLDEGRVVFDGTMEELRARCDGAISHVSVYLAEAASQGLRAVLSQHAELEWNAVEPWVLRFKSEQGCLLPLLRTLVERSSVRDIRVEQASIEEVIFSLYGHGLRKGPRENAKTGESNP